MSKPIMIINYSNCRVAIVLSEIVSMEEHGDTLYILYKNGHRGEYKHDGTLFEVLSVALEKLLKER